MNKAQRLAAKLVVPLDRFTEPTTIEKEAATLLFKQDEALRLALGLINEYMEHSFIEANKAAITKINEVLHD